MLIRKATLCSFGSRLTPPLIKIAVKIVNRPLRSPHGTRLQGYERELLQIHQVTVASLARLKYPKPPPFTDASDAHCNTEPLSQVVAQFLGDAFGVGGQQIES